MEAGAILCTSAGCVSVPCLHGQSHSVGPWVHQGQGDVDAGTLSTLP